MALTEGQLITYAIDEVVETVTNMTPMAKKTEKYTPPAASMQRSQNTVWMPVEQQRQTQTGWDLTGKATDLLELSVECNMGDPDNDFFQLRADDLRDERTYRRAISASAMQLANNVEKSIAQQAVDMATLVVNPTTAISSNPGDGWSFVAQGEELLFARELDRSMGTAFFFNPADYKKAGYDLVNRNVFGEIPEKAYNSGDIQRQVAGFNDVLRSPKLPNIVGSTATGITVSGAQKFAPVAWKLDTDGNRRNVDNRIAQVTLSSTTGLKRGDKLSFTGVKFLSQMAKNVLTNDATFTVVSVDDGTHVTISPKPIALDDTSLTLSQKAYANVNTSLADTMVVKVLNPTTLPSNVFWANDSIRLLSQPIPLNHDLFSGMKTASFDIPDVGLNGVIAFQGDINGLTGKCRIALWYAACTVRPEAVGIGFAPQS